MAKDKDPTLDRFSYEFQKSFWDTIKHDLHKVYIKAFHSKYLGNTIRKENAKFIPKVGNPKKNLYVVIDHFVECFLQNHHQTSIFEAPPYAFLDWLP